MYTIMCPSFCFIEIYFPFQNSKVPASRDPVCLFSLEYIPSVTNCVITTSTKDLTGKLTGC